LDGISVYPKARSLATTSKSSNHEKVQERKQQDKKKENKEQFEVLFGIVVSAIQQLK
jgi:hypothetical protein